MVTYQESPPWQPTMFKSPIHYSVPRILTVKQESKHIRLNHGRWKSSATTEKLSSI